MSPLSKGGVVRGQGNGLGYPRTRRGASGGDGSPGSRCNEIGRAYGEPHNSICCLLLPRGGIPPAARRHDKTGTWTIPSGT